MKVPYREDLASHSGPEPHGGCGNTTADACKEVGTGKENPSSRTNAGKDLD